MILNSATATNFGGLDTATIPYVAPDRTHGVLKRDATGKGALVHGQIPAIPFTQKT